MDIVKGVTLTPPVIGRITMGHTVLRKKAGESKPIPVKDDHFHLTTLVQNKDDRSWEPHPLEAKLIEQSGQEKLRAIPVRIAYDNPNLNLVNRFSAFDPLTGRVLCAGNGQTAKRATEDGVQEIGCPRPEGCEFGQRQRCKGMSRAYFKVEGQDDELGTFILRTTSHNSLNALATRLSQLHGLTGGKIAGLPMMLLMVTKTSTQSFREPFQYADLVQRPGMSLLATVKAAVDYHAAMAEAGLSIEGLEQALVAGLANGDFADDVEDLDEWLSDDDLVRLAGGQTAQGQRGGMRGLDNLQEKLKGLERAATGQTEATNDAAEAAEVESSTQQQLLIAS